MPSLMIDFMFASAGLTSYSGPWSPWNYRQQSTQAPPGAPASGSAGPAGGQLAGGQPAKVLPSWPVPPGELHLVSTLVGPSFYVPVTMAISAQAYGGQVVTFPNSAGPLSGKLNMDIAVATMCNAGLYRIVVIMDQDAKLVNQLRLMWLNANTGQEVAVGTDLSQSIVRIFAMGV